MLGEDRIIPPALAGFPTAWFAPDYKSLLEVWRDCLRILEPVTKRTDVQQKRIELHGGGLIEFWSLDGDPESCRGRHYKRIVIDEAAKVRRLQIAWELAISATLIDYIGDAWLLTTPRGRDYLWELWQRGQSKHEDWDDWASWQMPTATNPFIPPSEIERFKKENPTTVYNQEILAQFLDVGGRFFDEWAEERDGDEWHVVTPFKVPAHWLTNAFGGLDYGTAAPFSFHLAVGDDHGDVVIMDEEYEERQLPKAQAKRVRECIERAGIANIGSVLIAADPSMFPPKDPAKRLGEYPIEAFWAEGLSCVKAINDRVATNTNAKQYMHDSRVLKRNDGTEYVKPALRVFKGRCKNLIRTIPLMITDEKDVEDFDTTLEDHAVDSGLRYLLSTRPRKSINLAVKINTDEYEKIAANAARGARKL